MKIRGEGKLGLVLLVAGIAPALIKKSKPLANYVADHLSKAADYLRTDEPAPTAQSAEVSVEEPIQVPVQESAQEAAPPAKSTAVPKSKAASAAKSKESAGKAKEPVKKSGNGVNKPPSTRKPRS